ncbi:MAG: AtpZ/AtpI family protein [Hyphomicrobiales bacterium]|nr:AtpZ/AtpI family protein [Hyphomicrobiales bacterium]MDE2114593.1 AtpZ/AtpI family protein [Hyphomicrobiales bacterium]
MDDKNSEKMLQSRLDKLGEALDDTRATSQKDAEDMIRAQGSGQAMNLAFRVLSELVAAVVVGAFIGWNIDKWLGTTPIGLIVFLTFGTAAGFWNLYRMVAVPQGKGRPK